MSNQDEQAGHLYRVEQMRKILTDLGYKETASGALLPLSPPPAAKVTALETEPKTIRMKVEQEHREPRVVHMKVEQEHREPQIVRMKVESAPDTKKPPEGGAR